MRRRLLLLTLLLAVAEPGSADDAPRPAAPEEALVTLRAAVAAGHVTARGERPSGYSKVHLTLTSASEKPLALDVCGARLGPETPRSCQRLGVGPPVDREAARRPRPGVVVVDLAPGETKSLLFQTCCLDLRLRSPRGQRFHVLPEPAAPAAERVLRWWADHPEAPQGAVNSAIWSGRETVAWDPRGGSAALSWSGGRHQPAVASCAGTVYQLFEGRLTALGSDGEQRVLGSEIVQMIPTPEAIYAVFPTSHWQAELRRLALTGDDDDTWAWVSMLDDSGVPTGVLAAPGGGLLLLCADRILRLPKGRQEPEALLAGDGPCSGRLEPGGAATLVTSRRRSGQGWVGVTHSLVADIQAPLRTGEYWNLREVRAGGAGVFGLTHVGNLVRILNAKEKGVGAVEHVQRILFVGRHVLWLRGQDGRAYAVDPDTGREVSRPGEDAEDAALALDTVSGDLVGVRRGRWFRWQAKDGVVEVLPAP